MKVLDIIKLVSKLLNESDDKKCAEYCESNEISMDTLLARTMENLPEFVTVQAEKDIRLILDCINIVQMQICTDYHTLICEESLTSINGAIVIDNLSQQLYKIKQISLNGENVKYTYFGNKILVGEGSYQIKYAFIPKEVGFDSTLESHNGNLTVVTLAYGVCSQFCLIKGLQTEAEMWKKMFEEGLNKNFKKLGEIRVKPRRWF